jgi:hypothetical protein
MYWSTYYMLQIQNVRLCARIPNTAPILFQFDSVSEPVNICWCEKRIRWKAYRDFWNILFMVIGAARFLVRLNDATHPFRQTPRCGEKLKLTHEIYDSGKWRCRFFVRYFMTVDLGRPQWDRPMAGWQWALRWKRPGPILSSCLGICLQLMTVVSIKISRPGIQPWVPRLQRKHVANSSSRSIVRDRVLLPVLNQFCSGLKKCILSLIRVPVCLSAKITLVLIKIVYESSRKFLVYTDHILLI